MRHIGKYAIFVSFFPQLVAGPIKRSSNLLPQFDVKQVFNFDRMISGFMLILWGIFKKVVIADRIAVVVNTVFDTPENYKGFEIGVAVIFFSFQIFCDFSAYTDIARGSARILGFELMHNFKQLYFATSIPDFWRRWHISLTTWFKDYVYISLGGNRVSKWKWYTNIIIVFLISGLWHGVSWNFIIWEALHEVYQLIDLITKPIREKLNKLLYLN